MKRKTYLLKVCHSLKYSLCRVATVSYTLEGSTRDKIYKHIFCFPLAMKLRLLQDTYYILITLYNHVFSVGFAGISGEFGRAMARISLRHSRPKIPTAGPYEPDMPPRRTKKGAIGCLQITHGMWFSVVCTLIDNDSYHHSGQNVVDSRGAAGC